MGKAGAYGIQGRADCFVDHVDGDKMCIRDRDSFVFR